MFPLFLSAGSESPSAFSETTFALPTVHHRSGAGPHEKGVLTHQLSNAISAPYEVPQYPIEQLETKLIK